MSKNKYPKHWIVGLWENRDPIAHIFMDKVPEYSRALGPPKNSYVWCGSSCRFHVKASTIYKIAMSHMSNNLKKWFWDLRWSPLFFHTYSKKSDHVYVSNTTVGWDVPSPASPFSRYDMFVGEIMTFKVWQKKIPHRTSNRGRTCEHLGHGENNTGMSGYRWPTMGLI